MLLICSYRKENMHVKLADLGGQEKSPTSDPMLNLGSVDIVSDVSTAMHFTGGTFMWKNRIETPLRYLSDRNCMSGCWSDNRIRIWP